MRRAEKPEVDALRVSKVVVRQFEISKIYLNLRNEQKKLLKVEFRLGLAKVLKESN